MNLLAVIAPLWKAFGYLHRTRVRGSVALLLVLAIPIASFALRAFWPAEKLIPGETVIQYQTDPLDLEYIEELERSLERERNKPAREIRYPAPPPEVLEEKIFLVPQGLRLVTCPVDLFGTPLLETGRDWLRLTTFDDVGAARQFEYVFHPKMRRWGVDVGYEVGVPDMGHSRLYLHAHVRVWRLTGYVEPGLDFSPLGRGVLAESRPNVVAGIKYRIR